MRARFIGGPKDKQVVNSWPEPPPAYWSDDEGDYELFAIVRDGEEALYKVADAGKPRDPDTIVSVAGAERSRRAWRWKPQRSRPNRIHPRPVRAGRRFPVLPGR